MHVKKLYSYRVLQERHFRTEYHIFLRQLTVLLRKSAIPLDCILELKFVAVDIVSKERMGNLTQTHCAWIISVTFEKK